MPVHDSKHPSQSKLSSYFRASPSKKRSLSPVVDLTIDSDEEPPTKRARGGASFPNSTQQPPSSTTAERWRFTPTSPDKFETREVEHLTEEETASRVKRREAFKKKLLLENNPFLRRDARHRVEPRISVEPSDVDGHSDDSADDTFKELSDLFSNKAKGKCHPSEAKSKHRKQVKKPELIGPSGQSYTPLELQVLQLKKENPGTVLMIEVGYKYKFFGDDAKVAAKELGMVAFNDRNFLVASIPIHRRDVHLKKLLAQGYRVGVVNQLETAALKKISDNRNAPFIRQVTNLYTAATYVDGLDSVDDTERFTAPPFMCMVEETKAAPGDVAIGMVTVCPSTGDVVWDDFEDTPMRIELETRLVHTRPSELLLPQYKLSDLTNKMLSHFTQGPSPGVRTRLEHFEDLMSYADAFSFVTDFYTDKNKATSSESFKSGLLMAEVTDFPKRVVVALAHAIKHLSAFSIADAFLETKFFTKFATKTHMLLAANTLTNLEIYRNETDQTVKGSLLWVLDRTKTKFGARMLRSWIGRPLIDRQALQSRIDAVEEIIQSTSEKLATLRQLLRGLPDLSRGICRIQYGQCTPNELAILLPAFNKIATAYEPFDDLQSVGFKSNILNDILYALPKLKQPMAGLLGAINLKQAREGRKDLLWTDSERYPGIVDADMAIKSIEVELMDELKAIRKKLRLPSLQWATVAGDEYLIEVKKSDKIPIPDTWISHSKTKYFGRYQPPEVKQKLEEKTRYQEMLQAEANMAWAMFLREITDKCYGLLRDAVNNLATADCLFSLALVALQDNYVRPTFTDGDDLEIIDGRHPMIEVLRDDPYVPNSIYLGGEKPRNKIITGPNMGGKSSCVRMIALIAIMAQVGSYVPAKAVRMGLIDSVLTRMGAYDELARGRSTFMVEMSETSEILHTATPKTLVILDELGRGTATFDGMAIASAVLQYLLEKVKCKTLFITHYPLIASEMERKFPEDIENLHMGYEAETRINGSREITFLYRLTSGMAKESFGIECGRLAGLPESILDIALRRSCNFQREVSQRAKRNCMIKGAQLINQCLENAEKTDDRMLHELRDLANLVLNIGA